MKNKIAVVTGGSRGLGRSTVINLAKRGVRSIFTYEARPDAAESVVAAASDLGVQTVALQLDLGDSARFDGFVEDVGSALADMGAERFDFLVNNAGVSHH